MTGSVYKCNCQCWQCQTNNHIGCESNDSVCNFNKTDVDDLTKLAWEIEKLPASEQQTKIITMLTNIRQNQPSEKKALSVEEIEKIIYRNHFKRYNGITPNDAQSHKTLAQAIHSALPARKEVKWPEKMDEERFYCEDGDIYRGREWNECRDACIAAYEEAIPAHQYIEYLKSENESLRKFPPCGTAQREVRYPEKDYCGKRKTALHKDNCEECKYHKLRNKLIDEFKKLNS